MASPQDVLGMSVHFTSNIHTETYPTIDPRKAQLEQGLTVCLIGVSRDIGAHTAYSFAHAGASAIAICSPTEEENAASPIPAELRTINPHIKFYQGLCDVRNPASIEEFSRSVAKEFGKVDIVVYNAGWFGKWETRANPTPLEFATAFDVNCKGVYLASYFFLPLMKDSDVKSFISITSIGAQSPGGPGALMGYSSSKFAQCRIIQFLAARDKNTFFAALHPGNVQTEFARQSAPVEHTASKPARDFLA
ncbi:MAG: hypothetical protein M1822_004708 [Bathelium mastoideum]|nr:MAG: hypothetical protein M1822_004708 [Bathelium mastoideum]